MSLDPQLQRRVVIESVRPQVDAGRFPIKRVPGERVYVSADIFADGHDVLAAALLYRKTGDAAYRILPRSSYADFLGRWLVDAMQEFAAPL